MSKRLTLDEKIERLKKQEAERAERERAREEKRNTKAAEFKQLDVAVVDEAIKVLSHLSMPSSIRELKPVFERLKAFARGEKYCTRVRGRKGEQIAVETTQNAPDDRDFSKYYDGDPENATIAEMVGAEDYDENGNEVAR